LHTQRGHFLYSIKQLSDKAGNADAIQKQFWHIKKCPFCFKTDMLFLNLLGCFSTCFLLQVAADGISHTMDNSLFNGFEFFATNVIS
jgi:hypothetical protein